MTATPGAPLKLPLPVENVEPLQGKIMHGAFSNPMFSEVLKHFGKVAFARSSACMEMEAFLRRINASGGTCLEIGTYQGMSAVLLSQFFERVVCVSVDDDLRRIIKHDIVHHLGITNIQFFDVANNAEKAKLVESLQFDFCYMDGDHTNDTHADFALVRRCGRVLFHEYWALMPPVWNLVNALPQHEVTRAHFDCFAYWEGKRG